MSSNLPASNPVTCGWKSFQRSSVAASNLQKPLDTVSIAKIISSEEDNWFMDLKFKIHVTDLL